MSEEKEKNGLTHYEKDLLQKCPNAHFMRAEYDLNNPPEYPRVHGRRILGNKRK